MIPGLLLPWAAHLWQSTVFAAVAALLAVALRRNQARVRYWLWLAASYKFLTPFSLLVSIGGLFRWRAAPAAIPHAVATVTNFVSDPVFLTTDSTVQPASNHPPMLLLAIWVVWACGFVVVLARWMREWMRIRAIVRAAAPLQLNLPVRVASTVAWMEPGVFGIFRPVLLLPEGIADRLTSDQLQAALAHELCHVRRRDNLTAAIHMLVEAVFWFYPVVWWLGARMIDERERACDEEVLRAGSHAQVYAESILRVCEFYLESPLTCVSGISGSDLKKRIRRIMQERFGAALSARKKLMLVVAGIAALLVPIIAGALTLPRLSADAPTGQSSAVPTWQVDAGGKMAFDVASVKPSKSNAPGASNIPMDAGAQYPETGGLFRSSNFPLAVYFYFAYKLTSQTKVTGLPGWARTDRFDIEARTEAKAPTKDQIRLMMQSLLADRFKLAIHRETQELPVFALVLAKSGRMGPQLRPDNADCSVALDPYDPSKIPTPSVPSASSGPQLPPIPCGSIGYIPPSAPGRQRFV